jgi:hypothetical protein
MASSSVREDTALLLSRICLEMTGQFTKTRSRQADSKSRCFRVSITERYCLSRICFETTSHPRSRRHAVNWAEDVVDEHGPARPGPAYLKKVSLCDFQSCFPSFLMMVCLGIQSFLPYVLSCLFVCFHASLGRMTVVSSRSHASCRVWARTHRFQGSHKATRHAARGRQDQFLTFPQVLSITYLSSSSLPALAWVKKFYYWL